MSKLFIDLYYFVKSSFLKIETVNNDVSLIHLIPTGTNRKWKCRAPAGNEGHEEASNYVPFLNAKFCAVILCRSKAQLILKN